MNREILTEALRVFWRARIDIRLEQLLPHPAATPPTLHEAMRHAVLDGGKRLRPLLCLGSWLAASGPVLASRVFHDPDAAEGEPGFARALDAGCAVELLHGYSLVHDDLPAMDNDDLRRGRLSCHKAFGEAAAILAGDALQALAFETLAAAFAPAPNTGAAVVELARAAGSVGMCGGQMLDLEGEKQAPDPKRVEAIDRWKTGALLVSACRLGAFAASATPEKAVWLGDFGRHAGLMYQVVDDLLDTTGSVQSLGKTPGKDQQAGKQTYVAAHGLEGARHIARELADAARESLAPLGDAADFLQDLLTRLYARSA